MQFDVCIDFIAFALFAFMLVWASELSPYIFQIQGSRSRAHPLEESPGGVGGEWQGFIAATCAQAS